MWKKPHMKVKLKVMKWWLNLLIVENPVIFPFSEGLSYNINR